MSDGKDIPVIISDAAIKFLVDFLTKSGPVLVAECSERYEILEALLKTGRLPESQFKLTAAIQRSAQLTLPKSVSVDVIMETVIHWFPGVTKEKLFSNNRRSDVVLARHIAMLLIVEFVVPRPSYQMVANMFDRDHTTVMHAIKSITKSIDQKPAVYEIVDNILHEISFLYGCNVFGAV